MANFEIAVSKVIAREGGDKITNISGDAGGLTKYGISQRSYPMLTIESLTERAAKDIYLFDYWSKIQGDKIESQIVAECLFDFAVNAGVKTAVVLAQIAMGLSKEADGIFGSKTLAAINNCSYEAFLASFTLAKISRYAGICNRDKTQNKFLLGWINRALGAYK
jgi:lysozyme family protein